MITGLVAASMAAGAAIAATTRMVKPAPAALKGNVAEAPAAGILLKRANTTFKRITEKNLENRNLSLILREDFSKMTEGTETEPAGWTVNDDTWTCDDAFFNTPGWSGQGVFSAGGAVGLVYPGVGGTLNTPLGVYAGKLVIKFRAKAFKGDSYLFLSICKGGIMYPEQANEGSFEKVDLKEADGWKDYIVEMTSFQPDADSFVQLNGLCYRNGCLIDDIEIYRDNDFIWTPQKPSASGFETDGFTAGWSEVLGADGYLLTLVEEKVNGKENIAGGADFNAIDTSAGKLAEKDIPQGWDIHVAGETQVTPDGGEGGTPALVLGDGDYVQLPVTGGAFLSFSFFAKPVEKGTSGSGYIYIEVLDPASGEWKTYGFMSADAFPKDGQTVAMKDFEEQYPGAYDFKGLYTGVRIRLQHCDNPTVIDNIKYETTPASERRIVAEDIQATATSYKFTGLDPEAEHYFTVKARKGETISGPTNLTHAFGVSRPVVKEASGIDRRGGFSANWEYTPKADRYKVDVYSVDETDADKPAAVILSEDFSGVLSATGTTQSPEEVGNYYDLIDLVEFTDSPGWEGRGNIIVEGMLGCMQDQTGSFELFSPVMSLHNNNGNYRVTMSVASVPGDTFIVQGTGVYAAYPVEEEGLKTIAVDLTGGVYQDRLMFYTVNGAPFLIDEITVTQDLKKGDRLYTRVDNAEESGLEHRFSIDNSEISKFAYNLLAEHDAFGKTCRSERSDMAFVYFTSGVSEIEGEGAMTAVRALRGAVEVTLADDAAIEVFDLQGCRIAGVDGSRGVNGIPLAPGFYIVRVAGCSVKTIIK